MGTVQLRIVFRVQDKVKNVGQQIDFYSLQVGTVFDNNGGPVMIGWDSCTRSDWDIQTKTQKRGEEYARAKLRKLVL